MSVDERTLYAALQSPLPIHAPKKASANIRLVAFDLVSQKPKAEFIYQLGAPQTDGRLGDPRGLEVSALAMVSDSRILVLEHDGDSQARVYLADLSSATDTLRNKWHSETGAASIEAADDLRTLGIAAIQKELVADFSGLPNMPGKLEGLGIIDPQTIAVVNDNDFGFDNISSAGIANRNGVKSRLVIIRLSKSLGTL